MNMQEVFGPLFVLTIPMDFQPFCQKIRSFYGIMETHLFLNVLNVYHQIRNEE